ncbi:LysR family transcriptional regulator [Streptomyces sp. NBC_00322]|uniref:LysR family transcriptional regulator n=1 Tax=Streptomyces sp. NBC_00322 TaxID=2975712 RepID=UPI002E2BD6FC|nr:LysR family transcriptional regulator [Streptomyces sp. NBC_00322]
MELRHLRYALAVSEHAHFGRAAAALGIQQPPLSQQIKALETELGVRLFDRTGHGVRPTAAGRAFLLRAQQVLDHVDLAVRDAADADRGDTGSLAVGFLGTALAAVLPEVLAAFRGRWPQVRLDLRELPSVRQIEALLDGSLDAGFICGPVPGAARRHLITVPLARESLVAAVPADHPLAGEPFIALDALAGQPLILSSRQTEPAAADAAIGACRAAGFEPRVAHEADGLHTLLGFVACGLGVGIGPTGMRRFRHVGVTLLPLAPATPGLEFHLAHRTADSGTVLRNFRNTVQRMAR